MIGKRKFRIRKDGKPYTECICSHPELIENYEKAIADTTQVWDVHHRREEFYSQKELIERGEYYNCDPAELIFLTKSEHYKIDSARRRMSEARKGKMVGENNPFYSKHHSEETKRKISLASKSKKKVLCVETGIVYTSITEAAKMTNSNVSSIGDVCRGKQKTAAGYRWRYI